MPPADRSAAEPLVRCGWADSSPEYRDYHDTEWGRELRGDQAMFERLSLEAFQAGLSLRTILRKREAFRSAFAGFDPEAVAAFGEAGVVEFWFGGEGNCRRQQQCEKKSRIKWRGFHRRSAVGFNAEAQSRRGAESQRQRETGGNANRR